MSSILDALRKVEQDKVEVAQAPDTNFDGNVAERDLIGRPVRGPGAHWPPAALALGGATLVVLLVACSVGVTMFLLRGSPHAQGTVLATAPPPPALTSPAPTTSAAVSPPRAFAPQAQTPEPQSAAAAPQPASPVRTAPPAPTTDVTVASTRHAPAVPPLTSQVVPAPLGPTVVDEHSERRVPAAVLSVRHQARKRRRARERLVKPVEEAVRPLKAPAVPARVHVVATPPPASSLAEPPSEAPAPAESLPEPPLRAAAARHVPLDSHTPTPGALPLPPELRRLVKLNMPRPANKTRPYDTAVINFQLVFLNEEIPGTKLRLVRVLNDGVEVVAEDTGTRYYVPL